MKDLTRLALLGAAAGAAGTTALNAVTYLDMAVRGRPSSSTPEDTVEKLSAVVHVRVPGDGDVRQNRILDLEVEDPDGERASCPQPHLDPLLLRVPHGGVGRPRPGGRRAPDRTGGTTAGAWRP